MQLPERIALRIDRSENYVEPVGGRPKRDHPAGYSQQCCRADLRAIGVAKEYMRWLTEKVMTGNVATVQVDQAKRPTDPGVAGWNGLVRFASHVWMRFIPRNRGDSGCQASRSDRAGNQAAGHNVAAHQCDPIPLIRS